MTQSNQRSLIYLSCIVGDLPVGGGEQNVLGLEVGVSQSKAKYITITIKCYMEQIFERVCI